MGFVAGKKSRILIGDFHLAAYATGFDTEWMREMLDSTVLTDAGARSFLPDEDGGTARVSGFYDVAAFSDLTAWKSGSPEPMTVAINGYALGSEVWLLDTLQSELKLGSTRRALSKFELSAQPTGLIDLGVSLHDLEAETADENGTSHDGTAASAGGAVAHLHVTAFSGFSGVAITIEDSANNTDFSTIGTFSTVAAATSQRLAIAGTVRRYTRYALDVTGTGSITFQASLARR